MKNYKIKKEYNFLIRIASYSNDSKIVSYALEKINEQLNKDKGKITKYKNNYKRELLTIINNSNNENLVKNTYNVLISLNAPQQYLYDIAKKCKTDEIAIKAYSLLTVCSEKDVHKVLGLKHHAKSKGLIKYINEINR